MRIYKFEKEDHLKGQELLACRKRIEGYFGTHWHDFYEIEFFLSGKGHYQINGQESEVKEGMLYFMTPVDFHSTQVQEAELFNVMFAESLVPYEVLLPFVGHAAPGGIPVPAPMRAFLIQLLQEITAQQSDRAYTAVLLECLLRKLAHCLGSSGEESRSIARRMQFYVISHFREKLTLGEVAGFAGVTVPYASAVFKEEMQINFKKYLDELRFSYAYKLLQYSELSVIQVCGESGFDDYPNFIRRFKAHFGLTPSQVRSDETMQ